MGRVRENDGLREVEIVRETKIESDVGLVQNGKVRVRLGENDYDVVFRLCSLIFF